MRAIVVRKYGPPEMMEWREWPDPQPLESDVLVRVRAVGINFADLLARMGIYSGTPKPPFVPGLELAGEIVSGGAAEGYKAGDRVIAMTLFKAYAEFIAVPARQVFPVPAGMTIEEAAAMPVNYLTAWHSMFQMGNLEPGDSILIHGAAGGVGVAAVQLAKAKGLKIFGTAGTAKQQVMREMGVDVPIDYSREDFEKVVKREAPGGIEMVFDPIGGEYFKKGYRCLAPAGRLVVYGFSTVAGANGKMNWLRTANALMKTPRFHPLKLIHDNKAVIGVHLGRMPSRGGMLMRQWQQIVKLHAEGKVKAVIGKTFPLEEAAQAHTYMHERKNVGKVVLTVR